MSINVTGFIYVAVLLTYYKWYLKPIGTRCAVWLMLIGMTIILGWNLLISVIWEVFHADSSRITILMK